MNRVVALLALVALMAFGAAAAAPAGAPPSARAWLMFHHDERHSGLAPGRGSIDPARGPVVRWTYQVTPEASGDDLVSYRWYSSFPLGDLDGDGSLEVVVTSADNAPGAGPRIVALKDTPKRGDGVRALWTYEPRGGHEAGGVDQYSAALADADGDGRLDVLYASKDGWVRALKETTGAVVWEYQTRRFIEAGPMVSDLDGDGRREAVVVTDCRLGPGCPGSTTGGALLVFRVRAAGTNPPLWSRDFPWKLDSAEPAIADLDPRDGRRLKAIIAGSWGGRLLVVWRDPKGTVVARSFDLRPLDDSISAGSDTVVIRSSPLLARFGTEWRAVFGWMPDWQVGTEARVSAIAIAVDTRRRRVRFVPRWTLSRDAWKSSPALLPVGRGQPLVVVGYGIGTTQGTGNYGQCEPPLGGIVAIRSSGKVAWEDPFEHEGNVRASPAVADVDGDGTKEALLPVGCFGKLYSYDGETGRREWGVQLGPRTIGSPSVGDLDGDGTLEIVVGSYDGKVYALGGS